jgi:predicted ATPase with chaperone activity
MLGARVRGEEILSELLKTYSWVHSGGRKSGSTLPARYLTEAEILADLQNHNLIKTLPTSLSSQRRRMACMRVARTLADLERSSCVEPKHFQKALSNTQASFQNLFRGDA